MSSLDDFARQKLDDLERRNLRRRLVVTERAADAHAYRQVQTGERRELIS